MKSSLQDRNVLSPLPSVFYEKATVAEPYRAHTLGSAWLLDSPKVTVSGFSLSTQESAIALALYAPGNPILTADGSQARYSAGAGLPAVRQQFLNPTGPLCWQSREDILQVGIRVVPVHAG